MGRARPLFRGHWQPRVPADLGYYDLRVAETRQAQADLAKAHGITAFCYWHYWFAGRRILERPFQEVLASGEPDFPFCLAWANHSWTGIWIGAENRMLIEQTYPGEEDDRAHFETLLPAFRDRRYLRVHDKPLLVVFDAKGMPDSRVFASRWRQFASDAGLAGLHLVAIGDPAWDWQSAGFDGMLISEPATFLGYSRRSFRRKIYQAVLRRFPKLGRWLGPETYNYEDLMSHAFRRPDAPPGVYPCVVPNWDNTPRSGRRGVVVRGEQPEAYEKFLARACMEVASRPPDEQIVFIKSWNEWAEGNHLEPDTRFGTRFLEATRNVAMKASSSGS